MKDTEEASAGTALAEAPTPSETRPTARMTPQQQRRIKLLEEMTESLRTVAQKLDETLGKSARGTIVLYYRMGTMVRQVKEDEGKYGQNSVEQLAAYLNVDEEALYAWRDVTTIYTEEQVAELALRQMAKGGHIEADHVRAIIRVTRAADREKVWKRVFAESLSANQMKLELAAAYDAKTNRGDGKGSGRPVSRPTSPNAGAQQIFNELQTIANRLPGWKEVAVEITKMESEKIDEKFAAKVDAALTQAETTQGELDGFLPSLQRAAERVHKVLEKKGVVAKQQAKDDAPGARHKAAAKKPAKRKTASAKK